MAGVLLVGCGLCAAAQAATVPDYFFNGPITFSSGNGVLSVDTGPHGAQLISSTGVPGPFAVTPANIAGSQVFLSLTLVSASISDDGFATTASFTTPTGYEASLYLGNGSGGTSASPVLTGTLSNMEVSGIDGTNTGVLTGFLHPTGGLAFSLFSNPSSVIALNFNLSTNFAASMYQSGFTGQINGQVESSAVVPLPAALPLMISGLGLMGFGFGRRGRKTFTPVSLGDYKFE